VYSMLPASKTLFPHKIALTFGPICIPFWKCLATTRDDEGRGRNSKNVMEQFLVLKNGCRKVT
jgi:hypothetical protein